MNIENHLIQPAIVGRSVDLTPPTTMVAAFVGGAIAGIPGALVATPLVGAVKAIYMEARGMAEARAGARRRRARPAAQAAPPLIATTWAPATSSLHCDDPSAQIAQSVEQRTRNA